MSLVTTDAQDHDRSSAALQGEGGGGGAYTVPTAISNVPEAAAGGILPAPQHTMQPPSDATRRRHRIPDGARLGATASAAGETPGYLDEDDKVQQQQQQQPAGAAAPGGGAAPNTAAAVTAAAVSGPLTELYTIAYLMFFAILGTLARLGLQALTTYPGTPTIFSSLWPNFAGCVVMGFLAEDRKLFRHEWGQQKQQKQQLSPTNNSSSSSPPSDPEKDHHPPTTGGGGGGDPAAAKKAHLAVKKTIPLYIGLATGFCGSFTSFSSFMRDIFLAMSNDLLSPDLKHIDRAGSDNTIPRSGGYSFMALLAVSIVTICLSLGGLFAGAHLAASLDPYTPSIPFRVTSRVLDRLVVFLGLGCWLGAVLLSALPPDRDESDADNLSDWAGERWRGTATFALVFAPLGCLLRFYISAWLNPRRPSFPWGTFAVNILGTAVLGMAWDIQHVPRGGVLGCQVLQGIEDGFCGCLTTVSTWATELAGLRGPSGRGRRFAYVYGGASVVVGFAVLVIIMGGLRWTNGFAALQCIH